MHKIAIKMPFAMGWTAETCTARSITSCLERIIPGPSFDNLILRRDQTATVMVHESEVANLLQKSGVAGTFYKLHKSSDLLPDIDILWLPPELNTLDEALTAIKDDATVLGIVGKNLHNQPRFAARFKTKEDLEAFASKHKIENLSAYSRWRISGLPLYVGAQGDFVFQRETVQLHCI